MRKLLLVSPLAYVGFFVGVFHYKHVAFEQLPVWFKAVMTGGLPVSLIFGIIVSAKYAVKLGRDAGYWGLGTFLLPFVIPVILFFMKPAAKKQTVQRLSAQKQSESIPGVNNCFTYQHTLGDGSFQNFVNDPVKPVIEFLHFPNSENVTNPRAQHVLSEINRLLPDRVIIVGGWDKSLAEQLRKSSLSGEHTIHVNDSCSLDWLQKTVSAIRAGNKKAVLMSNFPRESNSLNVCPETDRSTSIAIFFWGPYTNNYCTSVIRGQTLGGTIVLCQLLVDTEDDSSLLDRERKQLMACHDKAECQAIIQGILNSLEGDQNCPVANWGGVLV